MCSNSSQALAPAFQQHVISYARPLLCREMFIPREQQQNPGCLDETLGRYTDQCHFVLSLLCYVTTGVIQVSEWNPRLNHLTQLLPLNLVDDPPSGSR